MLIRRSRIPRKSYAVPLSRSLNMYCGNVKQGSHWNQITFLTEWQLYAQKVEGAEWKGHRLDKGVIDRMSGEFVSPAAPRSFMKLLLSGQGEKKVKK